jgi:hypothetical protein
MTEEKVRLTFNLVGAPGSGKTALAYAFENSEEAAALLDEMGIASVEVLDNVPIELDDLGHPIGVTGSYYTTMAIYHRRALGIEQLLNAGVSPVVSGTVIDTLAHLQARASALNVLQTPNNQAWVAREMGAAQVVFNYYADMATPRNFVWYLPLPPQVITPGQPNDTFPADVDASIRDLGVKLGIVLEVLDGTVEERLAQMLESIRKNWNPPAPPEIVAEAEEVQNDRVDPAEEILVGDTEEVQ